VRAAFVVALGLGIPAGAIGQDAEEEAADDAGAQRAFRVAQAHYENGEFEDAAVGFDEAHQLSQRPQLLYNMYLAYRDAQNLSRAADALELYLEQVPDAPMHDHLRSRLGRMRAAIEQDGASAVVESDGNDPGLDAGAMDAPSDERDDDTGGGSDLPIPALVVAAAGALLLGGSAITGVMTASKQSQLEDGCPTRLGCDPLLEDARDSGKTLALVTDVLLFTGIAAVGVAAALWIFGQDEPSGSASASVGCGPEGCMGSVRVGF
jgi:hypothetical protein